MITIEDAKQLMVGTVLHHVSKKNSDGTPMRCRVNGKVQTWKRRPEIFMLPVKYGLKECFYISDHNGNEWSRTL